MDETVLPVSTPERVNPNGPSTDSPPAGACVSLGGEVGSSGALVSVVGSSAVVSAGVVVGDATRTVSGS